jgi:hypothetical protein
VLPLDGGSALVESEDTALGRAPLDPWDAALLGVVDGFPESLPPLDGAGLAPDGCDEVEGTVGEASELPESVPLLPLLAETRETIDDAASLAWLSEDVPLVSDDVADSSLPALDGLEEPSADEPADGCDDAVLEVPWLSWELDPTSLSDEVGLSVDG